METADPESLARHQISRIRVLIRELLDSNPFYGRKLHSAGLTDAGLLNSVADFSLLPYTTKDQLVEDQQADPPFGTNLTFPRQIKPGSL